MSGPPLRDRRCLDSDPNRVVLLVDHGQRETPHRRGVPQTRQSFIVALNEPGNRRDALAGNIDSQSFGQTTNAGRAQARDSESGSIS